MLAAVRAFLVVVPLLLGAGVSNALSEPTQDTFWRVKTSSGDFSVYKSGARLAAGEASIVIEPGDTIITGANGRLVLVNGGVTMVLAANTTIDFPRLREGRSAPAIVQQAGSVQYELAPFDLKRLAVKTPYLAATASEASFRIVVRNDGIQVESLNGIVEVLDFRSGEVAHIMTGQVADVATGSSGLSLSGPGEFAPVRQSVSTLSSAAQSSASTIGLEQAAREVEAEPSAGAGYNAGSFEADDANQIRSLIQAQKAPHAADVVRGPRASQVDDGAKQTDHVALVDAQTTKHELGKLLQSPRSDLSAFTAPATETANVAPLPISHSPSVSPEGVAVRPRDINNSPATSSFSSANGSVGNDVVSSVNQISQPVRTEEQMSASSAAKFDVEATRRAIAKFGESSNAAQYDGRRTREAIAKFTNMPELTPADHEVRPKIVENDSNSDERVSEYINTLFIWGLPLGIGIFVSLVAKIFQRNDSDRRLDSNYYNY